MIERIILTSLEITGIHILFWDGMILGFVPQLFFRKDAWQYFNPTPRFKILMKPLFECLMCMSSVWGITFWFAQFHGGFSFNIIPFLLGVAGLNTLIDAAIQFAQRVKLDD